MSIAPSRSKLKFRVFHRGDLFKWRESRAKTVIIEIFRADRAVFKCVSPVIYLMEGIYLAIAVVGIYVIFGPFVLLSLYVLFDKFIEREPKPLLLNKQDSDDPSLWTEKEVKKILKKRKNEKISSKM